MYMLFCEVDPSLALHFYFLDLQCSEGLGSLLEEIVEALCRHVSDDSPTVRRLCLKGLVQVYSFFVCICCVLEKVYYSF